MRIHAARNVPRGRVLVIEDGEVVADGKLADLVRTDGEEPIDTDIYVNPADVEAFKARWFDCVADKGRLN
jgi:uncharacterized protein (DUF427 family)